MCGSPVSVKKPDFFIMRKTVFCSEIADESRGWLPEYVYLCEEI